MKIRILFSTLVFALATASSLQAADEPKTPLEEQMTKLQDASRKLGRGGANLADATKNEASLAAVAEMKAAATEALKLKPKTVAAKPAADQGKSFTDYQEGMKKLIAELDKLSAALKAGKNDEAAKAFTAVTAIQKEGHKEFRAQPKKQ
jgi:soluble cytochrome b562